VSPDDWEALSDWLNAWIGAGAPERELLRARLIADHPGLAAEADALIGVSARLPGFLEIPAAVLAARISRRPNGSIHFCQRVHSSVRIELRAFWREAAWAPSTVRRT
jgi:hypothetical protein